MKNESKSPFLNFFGTINLLNPNKLTEVQKMNQLEQESVRRAQVKLSENISEYPNFTKAPVVQTIDNLETLNNLLEGVSERVKSSLRDKAIKYDIPYEQDTNWVQLFGKIERHKRKIMLCKKANKYNIAYDEKDIDYVRLTEKVERWESLIKQAWSLHLKVNINDYDPIGLEQRIEEEISQSRQEMRDLKADYRWAITQ